MKELLVRLATGLANLKSNAKLREDYYDVGYIAAMEQDVRIIQCQLGLPVTENSHLDSEGDDEA